MHPPRNRGGCKPVTPAGPALAAVPSVLRPRCPEGDSQSSSFGISDLFQTHSSYTADLCPRPKGRRAAFWNKKFYVPS